MTPAGEALRIDAQPHNFLRPRSHSPGPWLVLLPLLAVMLGGAAAAFAQPTFTKAFSPDTIGPGSASTLTFTINNTMSASPASDLAFTDNLPAGVTLADPAAPRTFCGGTLTAPNGGGTITFSDGAVGAGRQCTLRVQVTSSTPETHMNTSGDLTSSLGNSGSASDDLTVDINRPGFSKSFSPSMLTLGERSRLTFLIDNTASSSSASFLSFSDQLPVGLKIAGPANAFTDCPDGMITAMPGGSSISFDPAFVTFVPLAAGSSCTAAVDVVAVGVGPQENVSGELTYSAGSSTFSAGKAVALATVTSEPLSLVKSFLDDPVPPGATVDLRFSLTNFNRSDSATGLTFSDDLDMTLSGLVAVGLPQSDVCGAGSEIDGTSTITLTGGSLGPGETCTFTVSLQVPAAAPNGAYDNVSSDVSGTVGGSPTTGGPAMDTLFVQPAPILTKEFTDDPVTSGSQVTLEFMITNSSTTDTATDISFTDVLPIVIETVDVVPAPGFCGAGSTITFSNRNPGAFEPEARIKVMGGELAPGASCTFSVTLGVGAGSGGTSVNTTTAPTAMVDGEMVTGNPATDELVVIGGPRLTKQFLPSSVSPGDQVDVEFTLTLRPEAPTDATSIAFTDDLDAVIPGLVAVGLPMNDICGTGSSISGTSTLSFSGGTLAPGETCTFTVTLQVPAMASAGNRTNSTSPVSSTVSGAMVTSPAASANLLVTGLSLTKEFTDDPVIPGGTVTLEFTLTNEVGSADAFGISFQDDLDTVVDNMMATGLPMSDICGLGSSLSGTNGNRNLVFSAPMLAGGESCTFSVTLTVPAGADPGTFANSTDSFVATIDGSTVFLENATDDLVISSDLLFLSKEFTDDPVQPGDTATLEFTVSNLSATDTATGITFTDDLDAALSGLTAAGLPAMGICGAGSTLSGTSVITLSGGSLAPGSSCTFSVPVQVPAAAPTGTVVNTTSAVSGTVGGLPVNGDPATDGLVIVNTEFTKSFTSSGIPGGMVTLSFTIRNLSGSSALNDLGFSDDLDAVIPGLVATDTPMSDVCGAGSQLTGTSTLFLDGGNLPPSGSCTFNVTLQIPATATPGDYLNTTSELTDSGLSVAGTATDTLTIEPTPTFSKAFDGPGVAGGTVMLSFTLQNQSSVPLAGLAFSDDLDAVIPGLAATDNPMMDVCGAGSMIMGTSSLVFSGGSLAPMATCTFSVTLQIPAGAAAGMYTNSTSDLLLGGVPVAEPATAMLVIEPPPTLSKMFSPNSVVVGGTTTVIFSIDNSASSVAATDLAFTDNLPAGMEVSPAPNVSNTCGGMVDASPGAGVVSFSGGMVAAGGSCEIRVDVRVTSTGNLMNTVDSLDSSSGTSGSASAVLAVMDGTSIQEIPTLSQWGLILLTLGLLAVGIRRLRIGG